MKLPPTSGQDEVLLDCMIDAERDEFPVKEIYTENRDPTIKEYVRGEGVNLSHLRVSFEVDRDDRIRVLEIDAASPATTCYDYEEECHKIWWTRQEMIEIWKREKAVCDFHRHSEDDYIDQIRRIYCKCATKPLLEEEEHEDGVGASPEEKEAGQRRRRRSSPKRQNSKDSLEEEDVQLLVIRSSNRSLENLLVQMKELHRQKFVEGVLDQQTKVSHLRRHSHKRQQMIRKRSMFLSRTSKVFAQLMGAADAIIAQKAILESDNHVLRDLVTLEQLSDSLVLGSTHQQREQEVVEGDNLRYSSSSGVRLWDSHGSLKWRAESFRFQEEEERTMIRGVGRTNRSRSLVIAA